MGAKNFAVNNSAAAAVTFIPTVVLKDGQQYLDNATALTSPRGAVIKHAMAALNQQSASDRHYAQFTKTVYDSQGNPQTASVAVSVVAPRTLLSAADMEDLRAFTRNFLGDAAIWPAFVKGDY